MRNEIRARRVEYLEKPSKNKAGILATECYAYAIGYKDKGELYLWNGTEFVASYFLDNRRLKKDWPNIYLSLKMATSILKRLKREHKIRIYKVRNWGQSNFPMYWGNAIREKK